MYALEKCSRVASEMDKNLRFAYKRFRLTSATVERIMFVSQVIIVFRIKPKKKILKIAF